jgi:hypothetical protein
MRVNVYHEELTGEVEVVPVEPRPGKRYIGLRFFLHSPPELHDKPDDDDRSAVTLWVGTPAEGRALLEGALGELEAWERRDWLAHEPPRRGSSLTVNAAAMAPSDRRDR